MVGTQRLATDVLAKALRWSRSGTRCCFCISTRVPSPERDVRVIRSSFFWRVTRLGISQGLSLWASVHHAVAAGLRRKFRMMHKAIELPEHAGCRFQDKKSKRKATCSLCIQPSADGQSHGKNIQKVYVDHKPCQRRAELTPASQASRLNSDGLASTQRSP